MRLEINVTYAHTREEDKTIDFDSGTTSSFIFDFIGSLFTESESRIIFHFSPDIFRKLITRAAATASINGPSLVSSTVSRVYAHSSYLTRVYRNFRAAGYTNALG